MVISNQRTRSLLSALYVLFSSCLDSNSLWCSLVWYACGKWGCRHLGPSLRLSAVLGRCFLKGSDNIVHLRLAGWTGLHSTGGFHTAVATLIHLLYQWHSTTSTVWSWSWLYVHTIRYDLITLYNIASYVDTFTVLLLVYYHYIISCSQCLMDLC